MTVPSLSDVHLLVARARAEYHDMRGLRLTVRQAARLWQVRPEDAEAVLTVLTVTGALYRDEAGQYALRLGAHVPCEPVRFTAVA